MVTTFFVKYQQMIADNFVRVFQPSIPKRENQLYVPSLHF
jgi:hypothetical protein